MFDLITLFGSKGIGQSPPDRKAGCMLLLYGGWSFLELFNKIPLRFECSPDIIQDVGNERLSAGVYEVDLLGSSQPEGQACIAPLVLAASMMWAIHFNIGYRYVGTVYCSSHTAALGFCLSFQKRSLLVEKVDIPGADCRISSAQCIS